MQKHTHMYIYIPVYVVYRYYTAWVGLELKNLPASDSWILRMHRCINIPSMLPSLRREGDWG